nr:uncharacterized protein LOC9272154 isoform X6 [Oryza sativa Japonica Group]
MEGAEVEGEGKGKHWMEDDKVGHVGVNHAFRVGATYSCRRDHWRSRRRFSIASAWLTATQGELRLPPRRSSSRSWSRSSTIAPARICNRGWYQRLILMCSLRVRNQGALETGRLELYGDFQLDYLPYFSSVPDLGLTLHMPMSW